MLSLLWQAVKPKQTAEDTIKALQEGKGDKEAFLLQYKPFIRKAVSSVCKRYITEQDDEFSIGLFAFHQAIEQYSYKKGKSFFAFADLLIKRDVIDYLRKEARHNFVFLQEDQQEDVYEMRMSLMDYLDSMENENRKEEILHFQQMLGQFRISFSDLVNDSPKHRDTREYLVEIAQMIVQEEGLTEELFHKKRLPLKQLETKVRVSRKTLERHRKYIIAMCIVLLNEYVYLKEYIKLGEGL